jgi:hypothetical protein
VAILNPEHLFEQAEGLIAQQAGAPRQVDLRRAVSDAYYGVFHAILTAAADEYVGKTKQSTAQYALVYRSVNHNAFREVCTELKKPTLSQRYARYAPRNGFGSNIQAFAAAALELQEKRHAADYDPSVRMGRSDALLAVNTARSALARFRKANRTRRKMFLSLLLFQPR